MVMGKRPKWKLPILCRSNSLLRAFVRPSDWLTAKNCFWTSPSHPPPLWCSTTRIGHRDHCNKSVSVHDHREVSVKLSLQRSQVTNIDHHPCDQVLEQKVAQFSTKVGPKRRTTYLRNKWCFSNELQKSSNIWATFIRKFETKTFFQKSQIWSHWSPQPLSFQSARKCWRLLVRD